MMKQTGVKWLMLMGLCLLLAFTAGCSLAPIDEEDTSQAGSARGERGENENNNNVEDDLPPVEGNSSAAEDQADLAWKNEDRESAPSEGERNNESTEGSLPQIAENNAGEADLNAANNSSAETDPVEERISGGTAVLFDKANIVAANWRSGSDEDRFGSGSIDIAGYLPDRFSEKQEQPTGELTATDPNKYTKLWGNSGFISPDEKWVVYKANESTSDDRNLALLLRNTQTDEEQVLIPAEQGVRINAYGFLDHERVVVNVGGAYGVLDITNGELDQVGDYIVEALGDSMLVWQDNIRSSYYEIATWEGDRAAISGKFMKPNTEYLSPYSTDSIAVDGGRAAFLMSDSDSFKSVVALVDIQSNEIAVVDVPRPDPAQEYSYLELGFTLDGDLFIRYSGAKEYLVSLIDPATLDYTPVAEDIWSPAH
jgi:hypothetical protein